MTKTQGQIISVKALVIQGKLVADQQDEARMQTALNIIDDHTEVQLTITKVAPNRSARQNAYYWGVVLPTCRDRILELGMRMTLDETGQWLSDGIDLGILHTVFKRKFLDDVSVDWETGKLINTMPVTSSMTVIEFGDYIDQVIQFANEVLQVQIPNPNSF